MKNVWIIIMAWNQGGNNQHSIPPAHYLTATTLASYYEYYSTSSSSSSMDGLSKPLQQQITGIGRLLLL